MKFNLKKVPFYGAVKKTATQYAVGLSIKKVNEIINQLREITKRRLYYSNYNYWKNFDLYFFDSKTDRKNMKEVIECIKTRSLTQEHIDYIAGTGKHAGNGLLQYIENWRNEKMPKWIDAIGDGETDEKKIIEKVERIEQEMEQFKKTAPIPTGVVKDFEKKTKRILKKRGI